MPALVGAWLAGESGVAALLVARRFGAPNLLESKHFPLAVAGSLAIVLGDERGLQFLLGISLLVIGLVVFRLGRWLSKRDPQPELAPAA